MSDREFKMKNKVFILISVFLLGIVNSNASTLSVINGCDEDLKIITGPGNSIVYNVPHNGRKDGITCDKPPCVYQARIENPFFSETFTVHDQNFIANFGAIKERALRCALLDN